MMGQGTAGRTADFLRPRSPASKRRSSSLSEPTSRAGLALGRPYKLLHGRETSAPSSENLFPRPLAGLCQRGSEVALAARWTGTASA